MTEPDLAAIDAGAVPAEREPLLALGCWCYEQHTGPGLLYRELLDTDPEHDTQVWLTNHLVTMCAWLIGNRGFDAGLALAWVQVYGCAADIHVANEMDLMLTSRKREELGLTAWQQVGAIGPLAYAAGLTPAEACAYPGDENGLAALAALRGGWKFP